MPCAYSDSCAKLSDLLSRLGIEAELCTGTDTCNALLVNSVRLLNNTTADNYLDVVPFLKEFFNDMDLKKSGAWLETQSIQVASSKRPFHCPELDIDIYQPCQVTTCKFHTADLSKIKQAAALSNKSQYEADENLPLFWKNCILCYKAMHSKTGLDVSELVWLLGRTSNFIRTTINAATSRLRHEALYQFTVVEKGTEDSSFEEEEKAYLVKNDEEELYLNVDYICRTCRQEKNEIYKTVGFAKFCSEECFNQRRIYELKIEKDFDMDIRRLLEICINNYGQIRAVCHALKCTQKQFKEMCAAYQIDYTHLS